MQLLREVAELMQNPLMVIIALFTIAKIYIRRTT